MLSSVSSYASSWLMWMDAVMGPVLGSDTSVFRRSANDGAAGGRAGIIGTSAASAWVSWESLLRRGPFGSLPDTVRAIE